MKSQAFTWDAYREILLAGIANDYTFLTFDQIGKEQSSYSCLIRHDIDNEMWSCGQMSSLEKELGISSTYFLMPRSTSYNLFCVESLQVVEHILRDGHKIGLHFMGELKEEYAENELIEEIIDEVTWLEKEFGTIISAVSFHQPSRHMIERPIFLKHLINTYHRGQMGDYFYVSDTNMTWKHEEPLDIFIQKIYPRFQLLVHPMWWTAEPLSVIGKWEKVFQDNGRTVIHHWQQRERSLQGTDLMHLVSATEVHQ